MITYNEIFNCAIFSYYWDPITNKHNPYNAESLFLAYIISKYDSIDNIINKQNTLKKIK